MYNWYICNWNIIVEDHCGKAVRSISENKWSYAFRLAKEGVTLNNALDYRNNGLYRTPNPSPLTW